MAPHLMQIGNFCLISFISLSFKRPSHFPQNNNSMATSTNNENSVMFVSNFEDEHQNLNINLKRMSESNYSPLLNWMDKNKSRLLGVLAVVALSVAINCFILFVTLSSLGKSENSVQLPLRTADNQNKTKTTSVFSCPNDWTAYTDIKCIKVIDHMETYEGAVELCRKADSAAYLLDIQTNGEQRFMEKLIFTDLQLFNSVWLGGQLSNTTDDQKRQYSNWAEGNPSLGNDRKCIQMLADHHAEGAGMWISVRCQQKGAVVCQRLQNWSLVKLQENLIKTTITVEHQQKEIEKLKEDTIPLGFIYVQLPNQLDPAELWSHLTWEDISVDYADVFFRVIGNKTEPFGQIQNEDSPRLFRVTIRDNPSFSPNSDYQVIPGIVANIPVRDPHYQSSYESIKNMQLHVNKAEVRPKNMAVKVWKRVL